MDGAGLASIMQGLGDFLMPFDVMFIKGHGIKP
jgi:hypothetical protein